MIDELGFHLEERVWKNRNFGDFPKITIWGIKTGQGKYREMRFFGSELQLAPETPAGHLKSGG
jgi:hypothetical protein